MSQQKETNWAEESAKLDRSLLGFLLALVKFTYEVVFGFLRDTPSQVPLWIGHKNRLAPVSVALHSIACLVLLCMLGPVGFVYLPLVVLFVARRRSASKRTPYNLGDLTNDVAAGFGFCRENASVSATEIRNAMVLRYAVLIAMAFAALLGILALFKLPVGGVIFWTGGITWALWIFVAQKAADRNAEATRNDVAEQARNLSIFREVFGGTASDWENVRITSDGETLIAVNPALSASMRFDTANEMLAKIADGAWEFDRDSSNQSCIVLRSVSDETLARRAMAARSGGLIGDLVDSATDAAEEPAPTATVTIAAEELFS